MPKEKKVYDDDGVCFDVIFEKDKEVPDVDILVAGFPGSGLIGGIAAEQLINSLEMDQIASIDCDKFPPTAVVFDGIPRRPVRFFSGDGIMLVKSDMVIPPELSPKLAGTITQFALDNGIEEIIIFDGIPSRGDEESEEEKKIWGVLSSHAAETEAENLDLEIISRGAITGISSSLLLESHENQLKSVGMMIEGKSKMPDPRAAAKLLEKFADYKELDIETDSLLESAEKLETQYAQMVNQANKAQKDIDHRSAHPPLYG
ncbi:MAG: proteasome assembly chaperone family protein [Thermoplasmatota archaeon]